MTRLVRFIHAGGVQRVHKATSNALLSRVVTAASSVRGDWLERYLHLSSLLSSLVLAAGAAEFNYTLHHVSSDVARCARFIHEPWKKVQ